MIRTFLQYMIKYFHLCQFIDSGTFAQHCARLPESVEVLNSSLALVADELWPATIMVAGASVKGL